MNTEISKVNNRTYHFSDIKILHSHLKSTLLSSQHQCECSKKSKQQVVKLCTDALNAEVATPASMAQQTKPSVLKRRLSRVSLTHPSPLTYQLTLSKHGLPFTADPTSRLSNNKYKALKIYKQQLDKLNKPCNLKDKDDIITSEAKLQQLGFVDYFKNLPSNLQSMLQNHAIQHYIPWRAVWKGNSISTPCRVVFDASHPTASGFSLNDLLAKGRNNLNKLQEIVIRWSIRSVALHTDIKKMYNTIKLQEDDWCYQRYLWQEDLNPSNQPEEKIIKTLIYGVKSSGNQAEHALRQVANLSSEEYPQVATIVNKDVYVDDCITGEANREEAHQRADQLELVLNRGGFQLKGLAFSGEKPPDTLSEDGQTIHVAGMKWHVESDELSLNIGDLNFGKKSRGKKPTQLINIVPSKLTRRHCASKVAEVFDLTGKVAPIVASMKIDLQDLVKRKLDWDDVIPDSLRSLWESNFEMMKEIGNLRYNRVVIPEDAINMDLNTIDFGDASQSMVCVAIYARFLRRNRTYSSQLVLARTRVVPKGLSIPRAELYAALINTHTGETVHRSLAQWHKSSIKLTDSQICLHWIDNEDKPLKKWVRSRVIEINRLSTKSQWFYIDTKNMLADIGTRRGATLEEVNGQSKWINGHEWMRLDKSEFPVKTAQELKLSESEVLEFQKECHYQIHHVTTRIPSDVQERYDFSKYLIDPNHRSFTSVVRIMAIVMTFCNIMKNRLLIKPSDTKQSKDNLSTSLNFTHDEIKAAERYFFKKATDEVIQFCDPKKIERISTLKEGILMYTGRILPDDNATIVGRFTDAMLDLTSTSFCVPLVEKHSPVAYSIVNDIHWNDKVSNHAGIETTIRQVLKKAYIIEGRSLVKLIKKSCTKCRIINKKRIEAIMGPLPQSSLTVAPAFYNTQLDLSGPYKSYSPSHKRTTVKIWLVVYCCCSTSAVNINVMDDYSTTAFILSFTRFASRYGFPKKILCDEGSQLVKGLTDMRLSFVDIKTKLFKDRGVEFETCPVGAHNMNGKVERKIREINRSLEKSIQNERLSIMQWETIAAVISNSINDLPLAVGNVVDSETMDLLTPNRLLLGRNNSSSPTGDFVITEDPTKLLKESSKLYKAWFETWLLNHVSKLMPQGKWFDHSRDLQVGDVVLFTKMDSCISKIYTYGMVSDVETRNDGHVRKVRVQYQNHNENVKRETCRSVRNLILNHPVDEFDLYQDLGLIGNVKK